MSQVYILIAIVTLAVIVVLLFLVAKNRKDIRLTPLTSLAFGFIVAGIVFGENRLVGYGLMGTGVVLSIIDAVLKSRRQ